MPLLALAALTLVAVGARADDNRAQVQQRLALTARLLADSSTLQRIAGSGSREAAAHLESGRLHHALAADALQRGDLAAARREVEEALRRLAQARRLVPDAQARQSAARQRYEQMLASLERLLESWREHAGAAAANDGDRLAAMGLIDTARHLEGAGRPEDALHTLASAESHVLAGMNRALGTREVDYTQRAAGPAEEFQLELKRHQALSDLVPLAVKELKPGAEAMALIGRYGDMSRAALAQAAQLFEAGRAADALASLRLAALHLQRALGAAGVATPAPAGAAP
ncbi:MAG: hypothetical protein JNL85_13890 [Rubrivivax sp.]|nr:hypothetical protein [Rubrivivax sp.]